MSANSGIGRATSLALGGFEVWLLCRDAARGAEAREELLEHCEKLSGVAIGKALIGEVA